MGIGQIPGSQAYPANSNIGHRNVSSAREWLTDGGGLTPEGMPALGHAQRDGARRMQVIA